MASDESTELVRFVTEGEVLYRPGDLRITITLSDACIAAGQRAAEQIVQLRTRMHGTTRRIVLPSDRRATVVDQD